MAVQQARQTARAIEDGEEGDQDVGDEVEHEGSGRLVATQPTQVVCREEDGENRLCVCRRKMNQHL